MNRPIRLGVIGAGGNTRAKHIPGFQAIDGVEVVAVANRTRESAQRVATELRIPRVAASAQEIINATDIDAVCIGTWPNLHAELSITALRAGKHVLTEARMAGDLAEAQAMLAESQKHPQLVAQIVPSPLSLAFDATVMDLIASEALGEVREVFLAHTNAAAASAATPMNFRFDHELSGKNTMFLGIFYEIALRWFGRQPEWVQADASIFTPERRDETGRMKPVKVPETLTVLGRYAASPGSTLADGARLRAHFSGVETSAPRSEIRINGSKAGVRVDLVRGELWFAELGAPEKLVTIAPEKRGAWRVEADFIDSIRDKKPVTLTNFATGVEYMRFSEAVWASWNNAGGQIRV
ncbi:MAG: Gfo/Idh/MocA family oxidoreductase [Opitutae bacterium]|nr:Gfo/Idh/MocA family oxidoreductase [Opitutae bacterium]